MPGIKEREAYEEELGISAAVPREHTHQTLLEITFNFRSPTFCLHLTKVNLLL